MTAVVCYKGQTLLQLNTHINQQQAGRWIMFSVNQLLFTHVNTVSSSETSGLPLCVKSLAGLCHTPPSPIQGPYFKAQPPTYTKTHNSIPGFVVCTKKKQQNNACERKPAVVMRQELEAGRKQTESVGLDWKSTLEKRQLPELWN